MRIYLPSTFDMLGKLAEDEKIVIPSGIGFALTPAVREYYISGDDEELAYMAFSDAARASLRLLNAEPSSVHPHRRVVISADCDNAKVSLDPDSGESVVRIDPAQLELQEIVAFHVDDEAAENATEAAQKVINAADIGDEDAEFIVSETEENLMSWYDSRELPVLVELS